MTSSPALSRIDLPDRGLLMVGGADRTGFLQGLVTNDVERVAPDRAVYAALLTAQGRFLHDFLIAALGEGLLLDAEAARLDDLRRRLTIYRLRAKVTIASMLDLAVVALIGETAAAALGLPPEAGAARPLAGGVVLVDPRHHALGARAILPRGDLGALDALGFAPGDPADYERLRLRLGVPDGSRDMEVERALILEHGFEGLNGVDWRKGCYVGQEVTARMHYRTLVKKRLLPVTVQGPLPAAGTAVTRAGQEIGEIRSGFDGAALALLRADAIAEPGDLAAGDSRIVVASRTAE